MTLCVPVADQMAPTRLPLIAGLAVCQAIEGMLGFRSLELKWPNDLRVGSRKLGGILVESIWLPNATSLGDRQKTDNNDPISDRYDNGDQRNRGSRSRLPHQSRVALIGIGVNVNVPIDLTRSPSETESLAEEEQPRNRKKKSTTPVDQNTADNHAIPTVSLAELRPDSASSRIELTPLVIACVQQLLELIRYKESQYTETRQIERDEFLGQSIERRMKLPREKVEIELPTGEVVSGRCLGLGRQGELIIETLTGQRHIASGNVRCW